MPTRKRTINYLRAIRNPRGSRFDLGSALANTLSSRLSVEDTIQSSEDLSIGVLHRELTKQNMKYLHLGSWNEDEMASVIHHDNSHNDHTDLATVPPPDGSDYHQGDAMLLIRGNHCLVLTSGLRLPRVKNYLHQLLVNRNFLLLEIMRADVARKLYRDGVKEIRMNIGLHYASFSHFKSENRNSKFGELCASFGEMVTEDSTQKDILGDSEINAILTKAHV